MFKHSFVKEKIQIISYRPVRKHDIAENLSDVHFLPVWSFLRLVVHAVSRNCKIHVT